jgi:hypothetical protein
MGRTVWAFAELEELDGQTGFVGDVDDALAAKLVASGAVQDPYATVPLKHIGSEPSARTGRYATRQMKATDAPPKAPDAATTTPRPPAPPPAKSAGPETRMPPADAARDTDDDADKPRRGRPPKDK